MADDGDDGCRPSRALVHCDRSGLAADESRLSAPPGVRCQAPAEPRPLQHDRRDGNGTGRERERERDGTGRNGTERDGTGRDRSNRRDGTGTEYDEK